MAFRKKRPIIIGANPAEKRSQYNSLRIRYTNAAKIDNAEKIIPANVTRCKPTFV